MQSVVMANITSSLPESSESSVSVEVSISWGDSPSPLVVTTRRALETIWAATVGGGGREGVLLVETRVMELLPTELARNGKIQVSACNQNIKIEYWHKRIQIVPTRYSCTPLLCTAVISLKHSLQVLSNRPLPSPLPVTTPPSPVTRETRWGEQEEHTTRPHRRQWCFRWNAVNFVEQIMHSFDMESGTHTALVRACCWLSSTVRGVSVCEEWVCVRRSECVWGVSMCEEWVCVRSEYVWGVSVCEEWMWVSVCVCVWGGGEG